MEKLRSPVTDSCETTGTLHAEICTRTLLFIMEINCVLCEVRDKAEETVDGLNITIEDYQL
jgi:hypothetical protein